MSTPKRLRSRPERQEPTPQSEPSARMSWLGELRQRNVPRVAAAYLVTAWLLVQVGQVLGEALHLPDWLPTLLVVVLALGFPLALLLAWMFEWTPQGPVRDRRRRKQAPANGGNSADHADGARLQRLHRIDLAIIALLLVALGWSWIERAREPVAAPATAPIDSAANRSTATKATRAIAVLPFAAMSEDPADGFFADGLSEEILNRLVGTKGLRVVGRTSSFAFKDRPADLRGIAAELGVDVLLEGSVRRAGDALRITAQLIDGRDGVQLWSRTYNQQLADIFAVQDAVAGDVARELSLNLAPATDSAATRDPQAMALYLQAKAAREQGDAERMRMALGWVLAALELDPRFAEAHALLALIEIDQTIGGVVGRDRAMPRAREAIDRALQLAPDSPAVLAAAGRVLYWEAYDSGAMDTFEQAQRLVERALVDRPDDIDILLRHAWLLMIHGEFAAARAVTSRVSSLEPIGELHRGFVVRILNHVDAVPEARAHLPRLSATSWRRPAFTALTATADTPIELLHRAHVECIERGNEGCYEGLCVLFFLLGDDAHAVAALESVPESRLASREVVRVWAMQMRGEWEAARGYTLRRFPEMLSVPSFWLVVLGDQANALGNWPEALRLWRRVYPDLFADPPRTNLLHLNAASVAYTLQQIEDAAGARRIWQMLDAHFDAEPSFVRDPGRTLNAVLAAHALGHRDKARDRLKAAIAAGFRGERLFEHTVEKTPFPAGAAARNDPLLAPLLAELRERNRADLARLHAYLAEHGLPAVPEWKELATP